MRMKTVVDAFKTATLLTFEAAIIMINTTFSIETDVALSGVVMETLKAAICIRFELFMTAMFCLKRGAVVNTLLGSGDYLVCNTWSPNYG